MKRKKRHTSLRANAMAVLLICWALPALLALYFSSSYMLESIDEKARSTLQASVENAVEVTVSRLDSAIAASRMASYDNTIKDAWNAYEADGDTVALSRAINGFMARQYRTDPQFEVALLQFYDAPDLPYYTLKSGLTFGRVKSVRDKLMPEILELASGLDTAVGFCQLDGRVYLVRNLVDLRRGPYGVLVLELAKDMFSAMRNIVWCQDVTVWLGDTAACLVGQAQAAQEITIADSYRREGEAAVLAGTRSGADLTLRYCVRALPLSALEERRKIQRLMLLLLAAFVPLMGGVLLFFHRRVNRPIQLLAEGSKEIENGKFGVQLDTAEFRSSEMAYLCESFNSMSSQLHDQFEHIYREELALRDARIMALQSQINPHFLNNTLEIVNWEARMAGDVKVCQMLEALSTILTAAMDRDKRATIHLSEELMYVDAYLYIIRERLGKRLVVEKDIAADTLDCYVPRLILQPILENAVNHGIGPTQQGTIAIRARRTQELLELSVENDGVATGADLARIDQLLSDGPAPAGVGHTSLGIRNVNQRLKVLYGPQSGLSYKLHENGRMICKICIGIQQDEQ